MFARIVFTFFFLTGVTHALVRNVPAEFETVQEAILACGDGDTVLVADGHYVENIDFRGRNIVVASHYLLDEDVAHIHNTILDGYEPEYPDSGSVVRIINGEDSTTALIGFTITGGTGTKFRDQDDNLFYVEGGGIIIENSYPLIAFNVIVNNQATRTTPGATSSGGGGIRYGYCAPRIHNNIILSNSGRYGGGVVGFFADGDIRNNVVAENSGGNAYGGGGLWFGGAGHTNTVINNTIVGNESIQSGGGIRLYAGTLSGHGNILWGNHANSGSQQVGGNSSNIHLDYCCVEGGLNGTDNISNYPLFTAQNLYLESMSTCIDAGSPDPQWNDSDTTRNDIGCYGGPGAGVFPEFGAPRIAVSMSQIEFSFEDRTRYRPLTNLGTVVLNIDSVLFLMGTSIELAATPDLLMPFVSDTITLIGPSIGSPHLVELDTLLVYHDDVSQNSPILIPLLIPADLATDEQDVLPRDFTIYPAYPNPFNPTSTISFALPSEQLVSLKITDIQGREVVNLLNTKLSAGEHSVEWNASTFASGTYFATLRAGKWQAQTKLTLLK